MTDITERLRRIYVAEGANYVQEAANEIQRLRAERDMWKDTVTQRDRQILGLVNDVHSCHNNCTRAGCVNRRLREALESIKHDSEFFSVSNLRSQARIALEQTK